MTFIQFVSTQIRKALPNHWKLINESRLLGREPVRISYTFRTNANKGKENLINILVLPPDLHLTKSIEDQLIKLRDYILSKDCILVVINVDECEKRLADISIFIDETLFVAHPNFLWARCIEENELRTSIIFDKIEELSSVIRDIWSGDLQYHGPTPGLQQVNLEIMKDECWSCGKPIKTVTGLIFPDRQMRSWNNEEWKYFNSLLQLSSIKADTADTIIKFVNTLRNNDLSISPVGENFSRTTQGTYLSGTCPYCNKLRGDFYVTEERISHLFSLDSRLNGDLSYYSMKLNVTQEMINMLQEGGEEADCVIYSGWKRTSKK
ncbi:MAG: hypothetical protein QM768_16865 [Agriterribacter sp.]